MVELKAKSGEHFFGGERVQGCGQAEASWSQIRILVDEVREKEMFDCVFATPTRKVISVRIFRPASQFASLYTSTPVTKDVHLLPCHFIPPSSVYTSFSLTRCHTKLLPYST